MVLEKLEKIKKEGIEEALEELSWCEFEEVVKEVFEANEYKCKLRFRFKEKKIYEIDVLAQKNDEFFCIDCKFWKKGWKKESGLKRACRLQEERAEALKRILETKKLKKVKVYPLIVTLFPEGIKSIGKTFIVPIFSLNTFLNELEYQSIEGV